MKLFRREQVLTIPNLLSLVRLLLIPVFVYLFISAKRYYLSMAVLALSAATDIVDGVIARKFNMVSDLGKILDPVADKLTQGAALICLSSRYRPTIVLIVIFALREICLAVFGYVTIKRLESVNSSQWHGKLSTATMYVTFLIFILFPGMPDGLSDLLICISGIMILLSFFLYTRFYFKLLLQNSASKNH